MNTQQNDAAPSTERMEELLGRMLSEVFGEGDPLRRHAAIDELYTQDTILHLATGTVVGREAIHKLAGDLRATHPHFVYTLQGKPQALHNGGFVAWGSGPDGEPPAYTGWDFIIVRDNKIAVTYAFLDAPSER